MTVGQQLADGRGPLARPAPGARTTALQGATDGTMDLIAVLVMALFVLPPFESRFLGRGGDMFAIELLLLIAIPLIFWHGNLRFLRRPCVNGLGCYLLCCLPSLVNATDKPRWLYGVLVFGAATGVLWCVSAIRPRIRQLDRLLVWAPLPFVGMALIIIVHQFMSGAFFLSERHKIELPHGGSNFLASMLLVGAFIPLSTALGGRNVETKLTGLLGFAAVALAITLTGSRLGMALLPLGIIITVLINLRLQGRRMVGPLIGLTVILVIVVMLLIPFLSSMEARGRFENLSEQRNLLMRLVLFDLYIESFQNHPIVGVGMFNGRVNPVLAVLGEGQSAGWGANQNAHNWALQCLGDTGIVGMIGFLIFLGVAARVYWYGVRTASNPWRATSVGFFVGFIAVTLHGLLEPNYHGKPFIYFFVLTLGLADQIQRVTSRRDTQQQMASGATRQQRWWCRVGAFIRPRQRRV